MKRTVQKIVEELEQKIKETEVLEGPGAIKVTCTTYDICDLTDEMREKEGIIGIIVNEIDKVTDFMLSQGCSPDNFHAAKSGYVNILYLRLEGHKS